MEDSRKITPLQQLFIDRYLIHLNGSRAAREAGYSERSARRRATELLNGLDHRHIQAEIEKRLEELRNKHKSLQALCVQTLACILQARPTDYLDAAGDPLPLDQITPEAMVAIQGWTVKKYDKGGAGSTVVLKLMNKITAAQLLAKLTGAAQGADSDEQQSRDIRRAGVSGILDELSAKRRARGVASESVPGASSQA